MIFTNLLKRLHHMLRPALALGLAIGVVAGVLPVSPAYAAEPAQGGIRLENLLLREQIALNNQQARLNLANEVIVKSEAWIANLQSQGKDTASLQTALDDYKAAVVGAQTHYDAAKSILDAKAGFDANGKVTDQAQALNTVIDAGRELRQFHLTITPAALQFRAAVLAYRQAQS